MINRTTEAYSNLTGVLSSPSSFVPSLSDAEKYTIIIDSIRAYVDAEMEFATFVDLVTKMKLFSGMTDQTDYVNSALIKLVNLSSYVGNEKVKKDVITTTLLSVLDGLSEKQ